MDLTSICWSRIVCHETGKPLMLARKQWSINQKDEQSWKLKDTGSMVTLGINGVTCWVHQWLCDPSNSRIPCITFNDMICKMTKWFVESFPNSYNYIVNKLFVRTIIPQIVCSLHFKHVFEAATADNVSSEGWTQSKINKGEIVFYKLPILRELLSCFRINGTLHQWDAEEWGGNTNSR